MSRSYNNFSFVVDSSFRPFEMQELLTPLIMYKEEYNTIENAISDLATKASVWEGMANEEQDPIAYAQYKRYADDLQRQATQLANNGLTPGARRDLLNLKKRYSSEITPIEQAYASRKAQVDEQRKALLQNPTLLLSRRADMTSLDKYLDNPQLGYDSYSGALLTKQVADAASVIAKELRDYGNGKKLDGFTRTWLQEHGYTAAEVAQAINNPDSPRSNQILNTLVNNVIADSGVPQWADRATLNQAYDYARQGLWSAVGQSQVQTYSDEAAKIAAQKAMQKDLIDYQMNQVAGRAKKDAGNLPIFSDTIISPNLEGKNAKKTATTAKNYISTLKKGDEGYTTDFQSGGYGTEYKHTPLVMATKDGTLLNKSQFSTKALSSLLESGGIQSKDTWKKTAGLSGKYADRAYENYINNWKKTLDAYYDKNIGNALETLGLGSDTTGSQPTSFNINDLTPLDKAISGSGPYKINAIELRFGENRAKNKETFEGLASALAYGDDKIHLKEIKRIAPNGGLEFSSKEQDYSDFIDNEGKAKGNPTFWRFNTANGQNGLLIKIDGKQYWADGDYLGNTFRETNVDVDAIIALQAKKQELINTYGEDTYYSSKVGEQIEQDLMMAGAASVRGGGISIAGGYKLPGYSLIQSNDDKLE